MVDDNRLRSTNLTFESKVKVEYTKTLFNGLQLVVFMGVIIFGTMIANSVWMTTEMLDRQYELGIKGQGQIYLKFVLWLVTRISLFFTNGVLILHNDC